MDPEFNNASIFHSPSSMVFTLATPTMKTLRRLKSVLEKRQHQIFSLQLQFSIFALSTITHCLLCSNPDKTVSFPTILCLFYCSSLSNNKLQTIPDRAFWESTNLELM